MVEPKFDFIDENKSNDICKRILRGFCDSESSI